ncbi:MAG: hypothetical protein FWE88_04095 [Phycisphaerae bacterium]|nr:hypothetical protein [Phycisphaerae bacterium]
MTTKFTAMAAATVMAVFAAGFAWAAGDGFDPPKTEGATGYTINWFGLLCIVIFLGCTGVLGFKHAKRSHVD